MEATTADVIELINTLAPFDLAEEWDNCGLQAGHMSWPVRKVLVSLDVTVAVMAEAKKAGADLVLSHHPLMIKPVNCIDFSTMTGEAIAISSNDKISVVSAHTNLDKAVNGLNDFFADFIGVRETSPLCAAGSPDGEDRRAGGLGRTGQLADPVRLNHFAAEIKQKLAADHIRMIGDAQHRVRKVAVCTGSGGALIPEFIASGADVFVTGDIKYHEAREIEASGRALIDVGHFASERIAVDFLSETLEAAASHKGFGIEFIKHKKERDPFKIF